MLKMIELNKKYIGVTFLDMQYRLHTVEEFSDKYNSYLVKEEGFDFAHGIMNDSEIEFYLNKQDKIIECKNKSDQAEKAAQDKKEREEQAYNNVYGFCDNITALQKGKVLKTLNKLIRFNINNYGVMTCKDFILKALQDGLKPAIKYNVQYYSSRAEKGYTVKPVVCTMNLEDGTSIDITKTEYDYALYLIENHLPMK
jgi:hypothetical protein